MKILAVIDSFGLGGAEVQLAQVSRLLAERSHQCVACSIGGPLEAEAMFDQRVERLYLMKRSILDTAQVLFKLRRLIRERKFDVVYSRLPYANAISRCAAALSGSGIRHVAGIDTLPELYRSGGARASVLFPFLSLIERRAHLLLCNTLATLEAAHRAGYPRAALRVLPNGIDTSTFHPAARTPPRDVTRLICVAALRPEKGVDRLVAILPELLKRHKYHLTVVGDGESRIDLERQIQREKLESAVSLLGARSDVPDLLRDAHIFVLTSRVEGFGIAAAEAAATGLGVVAMDAPGGLSEVVRHGRTGFLVPSERWDLFVDAVVHLTEHEDLRERIGRAAREHIVANYSLQAVAQRLEKYLTS